MYGKSSRVFVAAFIALLTPSGPALPQVPIKPIATTSGMTAGVIYAAMGAFLKTGLDINQYRVEIWELDRTYAVLFQDASFDRPPGHRGSSPHRPEYNVELAKDGLRVIGAHFVR